MNFHIYYRESDGEIFGWSTSHVPTAPPGLAIAFVAQQKLDAVLQRYDAATERVIEKTAEQKRLARLPTLRDVQVAVYRELVRSDAFMIPDYPVSEDVWTGWKVYRQMLRDLSRRGGGPSAMITAWKLPPDGIDPIPDLRERLRP